MTGDDRESKNQENDSMKLIDSICEQKASIKALAQRCGASHIRIFGSVARGEETPDSDIDILVDLPRGYDLFTQRMALAQGLQQLLRREIDLIPEHELNTHLRADILREAVDL